MSSSISSIIWPKRYPLWTPNADCSSLTTPVGTNPRDSTGITSRCITCRATAPIIAPRHFQWVEGTDLMGAVRPQAPHRSPRQAFGGNFG